MNQQTLAGTDKCAEGLPLGAPVAPLRAPGASLGAPVVSPGALAVPLGDPGASLGALAVPAGAVTVRVALALGPGLLSGAAQ